MKKIIKFCLLSLVLVFPYSYAEAESLERTKKFYSAVGKVTAIYGNKITVNDNVTLVLPTVKIILRNKTLGKLSDVKVGSLVGMSMLTIHNRQLIDTIELLPDR